MKNRMLIVSFVFVVGLIAGCDEGPEGGALSVNCETSSGATIDSAEDTGGIDEPRPIAQNVAPDAQEVTEARLAHESVTLEHVTPEPESKVSLVDAVIAADVEDRVAQGVGDVFGTDVGKLVAWVSVNNPEAPTKITMVWRRDGKVRSKVNLKVGVSPRWRTWSRSSIREYDAGEWTVEIYDEQNHLLDTIDFTIRKVAEIG